MSAPSTQQAVRRPFARAAKIAEPPIDMDKIAPTRDERLFLVLSIFIGVLSGLLVVSFRIAIEWIKILTLGSAPHAGQFRLLLVPALAGLFVAALVQLFFPGARGSGVNQTKAALYIYNGYISFKTVIGKFITSALAIGCGHSLGPEDPSLQIGAGVASMVARRLNLSKQRLRLFAPIGAAAGLAAAFNAPISAILFVIEEVIGNWSAAVLGSIVLSAISSVVVARWFWGSEPMFRIPSVTLRDPRELIAYAVLGVVGGFSALVFSKALASLRPRLRALPHWTHYCQSGVAGLLVGLIGFLGLPQVMGPGYEVIDQAMHGQFTWKLLLVLAALKILATGFSFLGGTPGGLFAPALFIGAMLGGAVGAIEQHFFPGLPGTVGTFALVGMGTFFAGFLRVPITSVFMVIEVSGNYTAVLPVMISSLIAYGISRSYIKVPLFDMLARQDGVVLPSVEERREQLVLTVEDAMRLDAVVLGPNRNVADVIERDESKENVLFFLRVRPGEWHFVERSEFQRLASDASQTHTVAEANSKGPLPFVFRDMSLEEALHWAGDWPALPVLNRADLSKLEGVITLDDILKAFRKVPAE